MSACELLRCSIFHVWFPTCLNAPSFLPPRQSTAAKRWRPHTRIKFVSRIFTCSHSGLPPSKGIKEVMAWWLPHWVDSDLILHLDSHLCNVVEGMSAFHSHFYQTSLPGRMVSIRVLVLARQGVIPFSCVLVPEFMGEIYMIQFLFSSYEGHLLKVKKEWSHICRQLSWWVLIK